MRYHLTSFAILKSVLRSTSNLLRRLDTRVSLPCITICRSNLHWSRLVRMSVSEYGSWKSPISSQLVTTSGVGLLEVHVDDNPEKTGKLNNYVNKFLNFFSVVKHTKIYTKIYNETFYIENMKNLGSKFQTSFLHESVHLCPFSVPINNFISNK